MNAKQQQRNREPARPDPWDQWVRRFWGIVAPAAGIALAVYARDVDPPPYWLVPIIIALLAVPGAGILDAKWRDRLSGKPGS